MKVLAHQAVIEAAAITHRGSVRDQNEDTVSLGSVILNGRYGESESAPC